MKDLAEKAGLYADSHIESAVTSNKDIGNPVYPPVHRKLAEHMTVPGTTGSGKQRQFELIYDCYIYGLETLERPQDAPPHNDPFDRIMLAQAKVDGLKFMTHDSLIPYYHEGCIWAV